MRTCPPDSHTIHHLFPVTTLITYNSIPKAFQSTTDFLQSKQSATTNARSRYRCEYYIHFNAVTLLLRRSHLSFTISLYSSVCLQLFSL